MLRDLLVDTATGHLALLVAKVSRSRPRFTQRVLCFADVAVVMLGPDEIVVQRRGRDIAFASGGPSTWDLYIPEDGDPETVDNRAEAARRLREWLESVPLAWVGDIR